MSTTILDLTGPRPTPPPVCSASPLLDRKMRVLGEAYRVSLGYGGFVLGEWMSYAQLLEEELGRREREAT